jgi:cyclopropane fatty-acyl-phospholipid synthase-like methyltransferase
VNELQRQFPDLPDWEKLYQQQQVESMPWYNPILDTDLEQALKKLKLERGTILDIGTGPGTQAIALAQRGFRVTATDISETAITKAKNQAQAKGLNIFFQTDDILDTRIEGKFDFVFDRGCFHVLPPERRQTYVDTVHGLIVTQGYLFLKCFSHLETREGGPYRFTPEQIREVFGDRFQVISIEETAYQGTLDPPPKALFCILQKY